VIAFLALFGFLGAYGLQPEEARYGEIAREMLASGDWLRPHLNGVLYFEKPPLLGWMGAAMLHLFPNSAEFGLRLVTACSGALAIGSLSWFALRASNAATASAAAVLLAATPLATVFSRTFATDGPFCGLMTFALAVLGVAYLDRRPRILPAVAAGVALGLASLVRSPIVAAAIYLPICGLAMLDLGGYGPRSLSVHFGTMARFSLVAGAIPAGVATAIAAPWFIQIQLAEPSFDDEFFIKHHFGRVGAPEDDKQLHREAVWYYIPALAGALGVLVIPFVLSLPGTLRAAVRDGRGQRFAIFAAGWILLLFTILAGKRVPYLLPALPWCIFTVAVAADRSNGTPRRVLALCLAPVALAALSIPLLAQFLDTGERPLVPLHWLLLAAAALTGSTIAAMADLYRGRTVRAAFVHASGIAALFCILPLGLDAASAPESATLRFGKSPRTLDLQNIGQRRLCESIATRVKAADLVAHHGRFRHALNFYTNRNALIFGSVGELMFGYTQPGSAPPRYKEKELLPFLQSPTRIFVLAAWDDFLDEPPTADPRAPLRCKAPYSPASIYILSRCGDLIAFTNQPDK
jgi:4-amino-4-deoxy-L-arabinose transferase-like glycosyltransferase